jgi:peroxiredoxin
MDKNKAKAKAPTFSLLEHGTGSLITLDDYLGKFVMLTFWVSWCPDCLSDLPKKEKLYQGMQTNSDFAFLTINVTGREGDPDDGIKFAEDQGFTFPILRDQDVMTYDAFGCSGVPYTVLLNQDHGIENRFNDRSSFIDIALAVDHMLDL